MPLKQLIAVAAMSLSLVLAGCGDDGDDGARSPGPGR